MAERHAAPGAMAESGAPPPAAPNPRFDWKTRRRDTIDDAQRYTRFVSIMKRALFIAALILLGLVVGYSLLPRQTQRLAMTFENMGIVSGDLSMIKPKLHGTDSEGNPFVVTADRAVQNQKNLKQATLYNVEADLNLRNGQWLTVSAPKGNLDADVRTLDMSGAISAYTDQGYEIHTSFAHVDLYKGVVTGPRYVRGQGPTGTFEADHFRIDRLLNPCPTKKKPVQASKKRVAKAQAHQAPACPAPVPGAAAEKPKPRIYLFGNVHMQIYPGSMKKNAKTKT